MQKFNEKIAERLAEWLSTMIMFYAVAFLVLSILFFQTPNGPLEWIQYLVQCFFQGVALPVLAFVAKVEGQKTTRILQETHDAVMKEFEDHKAELLELKEIHGIFMHKQEGDGEDDERRIRKKGRGQPADS